MSGLKKKIWFKVSAVLVLHVFVLSQSAFALNADDKYQKQKNLQTGEQAESSEINLAQANMVTTGYSGLANQGYVSKETNQAKVDFGSVAEGLTDCDLSTKVMVLKASGATEAEAATALIDDHKAQDIASALGEAGYDTQKINSFLGNIIKNEQRQEQNNPPAAGTQNTISAYDSAADLLEANKPGTITAENISYKSLLDSGLTETEIVTQLKDQGAAATDILKAATVLDRDMVSVAGAMQEAGFSNVQIAQAYIAKASDWAVETTVNVVNCAVQSLAEVLTGTSDIGSAIIALAYEVLVNDILQTGQVNLQDGQIMSSMNAIKNVAAEHGVDLQGASGSIADLENISGAAIVHLDNNHWAVVTDINNDNVTVMDNGKEVTMTKAELQSRWDGNMLTQNSTTNAKALSAQQMFTIVGADDGDANDGNSADSNGNTGTDGGGMSGMGSFGESPSDYGSDSDWGGSDSQNGMQSAGASISAFGASVGGPLGTAIGAIGSCVSAVGNAVAAIGNAVSSVGTAVSNFGQNMVSWGSKQTGLSAVVGVAAMAVGYGVKAVGSTISTVGKAPGAAVNGIAAVASYAISTPIDIAKGLYNTAKGIATLDAKTTTSGLKSLGTGLAKAALGPYGAVGYGMYEAGKSFGPFGSTTSANNMSTNNAVNASTSQTSTQTPDVEGSNGSPVTTTIPNQKTQMTALQNSLASNPNQTVLTMVEQGYSIDQIQKFYVENKIDSGYTERIIKSQVGSIVESETKNGEAIDAIVGLFDSEAGKKHTTTLARHLMLAGFSSEQVNKALLNINANAQEITAGIKQAEKILLKI